MSARDESVSSAGTPGEEEVKQQVDETLNNQDVVTKYRTAADIVQRVLQKITGAVKPGVKVLQLCQVGDALIQKETAGVYNKTYGPNKVKLEKGVAFPTCISINNVVCHFSPLDGDETEIKAGDMVKIDMGAHIDGYAAVVAHTLVAGTDEITGRAADVLLAAYYSSELVARTLIAGNTNAQCTEIVQKIAKDFNCQPIQGVVCHNLGRNQLSGKKEIILRTDTGHKVDACTVETLDVWSVDIQMSTGEGKPKELNKPTTVFVRKPEVNYKLKMQASRFVASEIKKRFGAFPFPLRSIEDKRAKLGIAECKTHGLVEAYPVVEEKPEDLVCQFKFTAMIMPSGILKITGLPVDISKIKSEHKISDESLVSLLEKPLREKKKDKKKGSVGTA